jgi:HTH-type transcriptional regulator/antitoxin HigA
MKHRVIKTRKQYDDALSKVQELAVLDPSTGSNEAEELELLALLVKDFEDKHFQIAPPSPIDAIRFRMEQQGLSQRDLVPFIGSRSKVSEILAGKRPLTIKMIRALNSGLGIPADVLLQEPGAMLPDEADIDWSRFPLVEMLKRGWIAGDRKGLKDSAEELVRGFFEPLGDPAGVAVHYRRTLHERSVRRMDTHAVLAWTARILLLANQASATGKYVSGSVNEEFMREVARLSWSDNGPLLAREFLDRRGIQLVIEPHLPRTHLDGAAVLSSKGTPVIGLTVRYDRLDNFWFTLLHELGHVARHLRSRDDLFIDDLDADAGADAKEREADKLAGEALIPRRIWRRSRAYRQETPAAIEDLATRLRIHPAIVAGRIRYERSNFRLLNQMVGHGQVRSLFPEVQWRGDKKDV